MEVKADYITRQRAADEGEHLAQRAAEAIRFEAAMVDETVRVMLDHLEKWNRTAGLDGCALRAAVQRIYERIGEVANE